MLHCDLVNFFERCFLLYLLGCICEPAGTVNGSTVCNKETGQCPCRDHLVGLECTECEVITNNVIKCNTSEYKVRILLGPV